MKLLIIINIIFCNIFINNAFGNENFIVTTVNKIPITKNDIVNRAKIISFSIEKNTDFKKLQNYYNQALNSLINEKIILSAGASGIGLATVKLLLSQGAFVYTCDIDKKNINKLKKNSFFNKKLFISECDASKEDEVKKFYKEISNKTKNMKYNQHHQTQQSAEHGSAPGRHSRRQRLVAFDDLLLASAIRSEQLNHRTSCHTQA